jgi:hypothetical protein
MSDWRLKASARWQKAEKRTSSWWVHYMSCSKYIPNYPISLFHGILTQARKFYPWCSWAHHKDFEWVHFLLGLLSLDQCSWSSMYLQAAFVLQSHDTESGWHESPVIPQEENTDPRSLTSKSQLALDLPSLLSGSPPQHGTASPAPTSHPFPSALIFGAAAGSFTSYQVFTFFSELWDHV